MLVPTQWYMEPHRIEYLLGEATRNAEGEGREEWLAQWIASAQSLAHATREVHDERYGPPTMQLSNVRGLKSATRSGCAGTLLVVLVAAIVISAAASVFF